MTRLLIAALATTALAGCASNPAPMAQIAPVVPVEPVPTVPPAVPASIGSFGFDADGMDRSVAPGDDFYEYANGAWLKKTPIPADKSNYGSFNVLQDESQRRVRDILDAARTDPNSQIGMLYASFLDDAAVETRGLAPINPWLDEVRGLSSKNGYAALAAKARRMGIEGLFVGGVYQDDKDSDSYILNLSTDGLGMPDRDMYLLNEPRMVELRAAYLDHLTKILGIAGEANAAARAKALLDFETRIAKVSWTREDDSDISKTYNKMSLAELKRLAPGFDWQGYLAGRGLNTDQIIVNEPSAFKAIAALSASAPMQVLKDQYLVRSLDEFANVLPKAVFDQHFAFYSKALNGTPEQEPRWKRAVDFTVDNRTDEVSKIYVSKYFPPESKAAMKELVGNVVTAMGHRIDNLSWMAPATKVRAKAKLAAFTSRVGYPDQWHDYSAVAVSPDDLFGNALAAAEWRHDWNAQKLGRPVYRWEWGMDPMTVNAQANFGLVAITFPAAILQPPFFDPHADPAINYGGIGSVIGHEMSHHFDDQGAKYDERGNLSDWWTAEDVANFKRLSEELVKQYDAYEVFPGAFVKGEFTLGENIGDLGGLAAAYDAYHLSLGGKPAPVIDGTTGDQRFYLGWAQVWRRNYRDANLRARLLTDPHAPSKQRTWIVRNFDSWYKAYDPATGQAMYLPPEKRVRIW